MGAPVVTFYKYDTATSACTAISNLAVTSLPTVNAGEWTKNIAFKIKWSSSDSFALENTRIWFNRTMATYTPSGSTYATKIDIGQGYTTSLPPGEDPQFWSIKYIYTTPSGTSLANIQSASLTIACPSVALEGGDTFTNELPAAFRPGDTPESGADLGFSAGISGTELYSKHIGISMKPNANAIHGNYTDIGIQVTYDFI